MAKSLQSLQGSLAMSKPSGTLFGIILDICKEGLDSQEDIDNIVKKHVYNLETPDFVEAQNLSVKIQKSFTNYLFGTVSG